MAPTAPPLPGSQSAYRGRHTHRLARACAHLSPSFPAPGSLRTCTGFGWCTQTASSCCTKGEYKGCLTQSTAPPKPPEGLTSGTCHRIAGLAGDGGPADMAVCHTHADSGRKSPTNTGGRGTRTQKSPRPEQYDHWRWNSCVFIIQRQNPVDPLEVAAGADVRRRGALALKVVFRITYLSYEDKLTA